MPQEGVYVNFIPVLSFPQHGTDDISIPVKSVGLILPLDRITGLKQSCIPSFIKLTSMVDDETSILVFFCLALKNFVLNQM